MYTTKARQGGVFFREGKEREMLQGETIRSSESTSFFSVFWFMGRPPCRVIGPASRGRMCEDDTCDTITHLMLFSRLGICPVRGAQSIVERGFRDEDGEKGKAKKEYLVGTWWNHEIIKAKAQISGISGRIINQTVTFIGKEQIVIGKKTYNTLRFNFKSSDQNLPDNKKLNTDIWYEEKTYLWVKASFDKSGYWEYRIKKVN